MRHSVSFGGEQMFQPAWRAGLAIPSFASVHTSLPAPMQPTFASSFDALSGWRSTLVQRIEELTRFLGDHELGDVQMTSQLKALRERLVQEKLVVAFVAEFYARQVRAESMPSSFPMPVAACCRPRRGAPPCARWSWPGTAEEVARPVPAAHRDAAETACRWANCAPSRAPGR